ncbi:MAG: translation initiation factor IF-3 [candidate division KSB1 bacterium]|nr:translation initiation factor IF-3 [candidate division KSB1 bacterium]MDZ7302974.1 translation initiation factor IF-3 [candidate division KSB1 bacterium]MDZ7312250.1 translation initiation factor IF-3 [candidate division KSB1 bacterium]
MHSTSKQKSIRVNNQIRVPKVRLIGPDGEQIGIVPTHEALSRAEAAELDLVEVAPNADPPVCRIMDYGKYRYEQSKREKDSRKKAAVIHVKEIRFRPKIEEHDFNFKIKHARTFIEAGDKVKVTMTFRGREMMHQQFGQEVMNRMIEQLSDIAKTERPPQMEGRNLVVYFVKK